MIILLYICASNHHDVKIYNLMSQLYLNKTGGEGGEGRRWSQKWSRSPDPGSVFHFTLNDCRGQGYTEPIPLALGT